MMHRSNMGSRRVLRRSAREDVIVGKQWRSPRVGLYLAFPSACEKNLLYGGEAENVDIAPA